MNRDERIVVVGAGLTGLRTAERLRELKFEGEIMLLGDEKLPPYHRPALSKQLLMGTLRSSDLTLPAYEDLNAKWRFGTQVRQLVPHNKVLHLPGGEELTYDGLVIATGVEAKRPNDLPYYDPRVLVLRTMADGLELERVIGSTKGRVAVVGGGFTGCEIAASLRHLSREVTLIGRQDTLLGNVLGPELGEWLTNLHRDHGVDLALGNSVQEWSPGPEGIGLRLTDGTTLLASCVVVAAGTVPLTGWLRGSGLPLDNGVVCEPTCHVVGAEDVVAAGDVAQWPNLRFDNVPRRVEHWLNAVEMGRAAAESLLAGRGAAEPFTPMPRFWTEQYGVRIQAAGMPKLGKDIITLGTPDEGTGTVYGYSKEGRLMGVVGLDCPSSVLAWTDSVSRQNPAPRRSTPVEQAPAVAVGGGAAKRGKGRHSLPAKGKQRQREEKREHEIAYVEEPPHEVGVGTGQVPAGRPKSVVDSFSRMLPVKVRQPRGGPVPPPPGTPVPPGARSNGAPVPPPPAARSNGMATPPPGTPVIGTPVPPPGTPVPPPVPPSGPPHFGAPSNGSGRVAPPQFRAAGPPEPLSGRLAAEEALAIDVTGQMALLDANGHVRPPEFHDPMSGPATMVEGMPPATGAAMPPARRGSDGSFAHGPVDPFAAPLTGRGPSDSFGAMSPARGGPSDSFGALPPVRRSGVGSSGGMPPAGGGPADSFGALPPVRRGGVGSSGGTPPARRGASDSVGALPPVRRGGEDSFGALPPVRRDAEASFGGLPPVRRGGEDSFGALPPVRRGAEGSFGALPPAGRGGGDSFGGTPPARRGEDLGGLPPARRGAADSFDAMPPVRRAVNTRPPRGSGGAFGRGTARGPEDPFAPLDESPDRTPPISGSADETIVEGMPPASRHRTGGPTNGGRAARRRAEERLSRTMDPALSSIRLAPALPSVDDTFDRLPKHSRPDDDYLVRPRPGPEDSYDRMPAVERPVRSSGGRRRA
ncbi:FAD-dependent oxidoreductase [Actinophytocola glycyrrhizae]|uniref:FAD-dependent oxidoreductase n=1 Tax=Actinophytocola glycyrrhizae TaxID=2044873 RepID=A0ABV9S042_9PSEU